MFKIKFDGYLEDEEFDTYEEAEEAAYVMVDDFHAGCVDLYNMNPGDYLEEMGDATDHFEIVEI